MDIRTLCQPTEHYPPVVVAGQPNLSFELWLEFEWWQPQPDDDPSNNFFNMQILLSDGRTYALNVWTFAYRNAAYNSDRHSGAQLAGSYLIPPDLLVDKLDRSLLESIVHKLIQTNALREEWLVEHNEDGAARKSGQ